MSEASEQQFSNMQQNTTDYAQPDETTIKTRLDPSSVIDRYEENLRGGRWQTIEINGEFKDVFVATRQTKIKISPECIDTVLRWLRIYCNQHTFQGNIKIEQYNQFMTFLIQDMACAFFDNAQAWKIDGRTANMLINELAGSISLTLTRSLDDKERIHLGEGVKVQERIGNQGQSMGTSRKSRWGF